MSVRDIARHTHNICLYCVRRVDTEYLHDVYIDTVSEVTFGRCDLCDTARRLLYPIPCHLLATYHGWRMAA